MSVDVSSTVWERSSRGGTELLVLLAIAEYADSAGRAYPSVATLAKRCRMSTRNVNLILATLRVCGELEVQPSAGPNGVNVYRITLVPPLKNSSPPLKPPSPPEELFTLKPPSSPPEAGFPNPLKPASDKPSLNRQEPSDRRRNAPTRRSAPAKTSSTKNPGKTLATWEAYSTAYRKRYGVEPLERNRTVNGQLAKFVEAVGADDAPQIAAFYLASNDRFHTEQCHPVNLLLLHAQKLRTQWKTGAGASRHSGFNLKDWEAGTARGQHGELLPTA